MTTEPDAPAVALTADEEEAIVLARARKEMHEAHREGAMLTWATVHDLLHVIERRDAALAERTQTLAESTAEWTRITQEAHANVARLTDALAERAVADGSHDHARVAVRGAHVGLRRERHCRSRVRRSVLGATPVHLHRHPHRRTRGPLAHTAQAEHPRVTADGGRGG